METKTNRRISGKPLVQYHETKHHSCSSPPHGCYHFHEANHMLSCTAYINNKVQTHRKRYILQSQITRNLQKLYTSEWINYDFYLGRTNTHGNWLKFWNLSCHLDKCALSWKCTLPPIIKTFLKSKWFLNFKLWKRLTVVRYSS